MSSSNGCNRSGRSNRRSTDRTREQGYALLAVVGVLAVLSVIAVTLSQRARLGMSSATAFREETRDQFAVEAGMTLAIRALSAEPEFDHDGYLHLETTADNRHLEIVVSDESRKADVNRASPAELVKAFITLGAERNVADALSHHMVDWRDADDRPHHHGGEVGEYLAADALAIPRNASFASLDEVQTVLGLPPEIALRLHEKFTLMPWIASNANSSAAAIGSVAVLSSELRTKGDDAPNSDGVTRSADAAAGPEVIGSQVKLKRASEEGEWEYFRFLTAGSP